MKTKIKTTIQIIGWLTVFGVMLFIAIQAFLLTLRVIAFIQNPVEGYQTEIFLKVPPKKAEAKLISYKVEINKQFLAYRMNNPCNLKFAFQPGSTNGEKGFARFETPEQGFNACVSQVKVDTDRGDTIEKFIGEFAPKQENDTELYIRTVSNNLKINRNTKLRNINPLDFASQIAKFESQTQLKKYETEVSK